jgi:hypothetical protein
VSQQPISTPDYGGVFTNARRPSFTITAGAHTYRITDVRGNEVSSGTVARSATDLLPAAPLGGWPNGWYLLQLHGEKDYGIFPFSIVNDPAGFAALPTAIRADLDFMARYVTRDPVRPFEAFCQFPNGGVDVVQLGLLTLCRRGTQTQPAHITIGPGSATATMKLTVTDTTTSSVVESYDNQWSEQQLQAQINAHSRWLICGGASTSPNLPTAGSQPLTNAATLATIQAVRGLHAYNGLGITFFEGPSNEPDNTEPVAAQAAAFTTSVHAGAAQAKALVPGLVTLSSLPVFAANCMTIDFTPDAISFHGYSTYWAFDLVRWDWDARFLAQSRQTPGWESLDTFQTEVGDFFGEYGTCFPIYSAASAILSFAYYESIGVPRQRFHWFYPTSHGFGGFPSWWRNGDSTYTPVWTAVRNFTERLIGSSFTERLTFPDPVRRFLFAARWSSPKTQSLLLQPVGISDLTITLAVSGTDTVTVYDWANNSSPITVIDGQVQIVVDQLGQWVVASASATVTVADVNDGLLRLSANYADPDYGGSTLSSQGPVADQLALAKLFSKVDPLAGDGDLIWWQDSTATLPYSVTLQFPVSQSLARMLIAGVTPRTDHQTYALMDFDIEYQAPGEASWQTCFAYAAPPSANSQALVGSWDSVGSGSIWTRVSSYDRAFIFDCPFDAPVEAVAVRLVVTRTSVGEAPDAAEVRADAERLAPATNLRFLGLY